MSAKAGFLSAGVEPLVAETGKDVGEVHGERASGDESVEASDLVTGDAGDGAIGGPLPSREELLAARDVRGRRLGDGNELSCQIARLGGATGDELDERVHLLGRETEVGHPHVVEVHEQLASVGVAPEEVRGRPDHLVEPRGNRALLRTGEIGSDANPLADGVAGRALGREELDGRIGLQHRLLRLSRERSRLLLRRAPRRRLLRRYAVSEEGHEPENR